MPLYNTYIDAAPIVKIKNFLHLLKEIMTLEGERNKQNNPKAYVISKNKTKKPGQVINTSLDKIKM